jgi:hypothetical protein
VISKPGDLGNHAWAWIAAGLILSIAIGSTVLRLETLHTAQIEATQADTGMPAIAGEEGMPAEFADPAAAAAAAPTAAAAGADPAAASRENAALAGFIMLAIIFVVTQLVGVGVGLRYGFAGKQSRLAHRATHGHADYGSYFAPVEQRMMIANARLLKLHQLLEKHSPTPIDFDKDFFSFVEQEKKRGATYLQMPPPERGRPGGDEPEDLGPKANGHSPEAVEAEADATLNGGIAPESLRSEAAQ